MNLAHTFRESFTYAPQSGVSDFGEPVFDAQKQGRGRVQRKAINVVTPTGDERQSDTQLFTAEPLEIGDRVWLSEDDAADATKARRPLAVSEFRDLQGRVAYYLAFF